jgi:hypothetical protein
MTALNGIAQCDTSSICTKKVVLKYFYEQDVKAGYLAKDLKLTDSIIVAQKDILTYKDSIILGQSEAFRISQSEKELCDYALKSSQSENKKLSNKVTFYKITNMVTIIVGSISTLYFLIH